MAMFGGDASDDSTASHDMEISLQNGKDFHYLKSQCQRNPGHPKFIPVTEFKMENLPKDYQERELLEYVEIFAELTVRVLVSHTSKARPKTYHRSKRPYPGYGLVGTQCLLAGSGWIRSVTICEEKGKETCPCNQCKDSGKPSKTWGVIEVPTANHLVFDNEEAKNTKVDLFYHKDSDENPSKPMPLSKTTLVGHRIKYHSIHDDKCWMHCITHDMELCERLSKMVARSDELFEKLLKKYSDPKYKDEQLSIIAAHPHGCAKMISVGGWARQSLSPLSGWWSKATYSCITCSGSSGAPVWSLGKKLIEAWRVV